MTIYFPIELEAHLQLVEERIDSGLSREEAEESITEQDKQTRVERLKSSGALERFRCWTYPMNKSMFDEVAYRSILEERMNSGLTKLEAMESITDEQVEKRITEKEAIFSCPKCGQKHQTFAKKTFTHTVKSAAMNSLFLRMVTFLLLKNSSQVNRHLQDHFGLGELNYG